MGRTHELKTVLSVQKSRLRLWLLEVQTKQVCCSTTTISLPQCKRLTLSLPSQKQTNNLSFFSLPSSLMVSSSFSFCFRPTKECSLALQKMNICPACQGFPEMKPCDNYCLNVMKGCLAFHIEIQEQWDKYIGKEIVKMTASLKWVPFEILGPGGVN